MELAEYRRMAEVEDAHWWYRATRALLQQILEPELPGGGRLLDVGCGTGATGGWLGTRGELVAVDFEVQALVSFAERHESIGLAVADATRLPLAADSFDVAICVTVLCHRSIRDPASVVRELARVVRPGGVVCLLEPGVRRLLRAHDRVTHTARRFTRAELARHVTAAGLEVERSTGAYSFLVPAAAVKSLFERDEVASDLDRHQSGLGGVLGAVAAGERRWLRRFGLPFGLSVIALGRKPA
jgi:ubiquinone/menaquinone biosynthesis C-methylase UbiE